MRASLVLAALLLASSCRRETPSRIVAYAEQHGAGDLGLASEQSIRVWIGTHRPVAREVLAMCRAQAPGDATWGDTAEGRLCTSVRRASFWGLQGE